MTAEKNMQNKPLVTVRFETMALGGKAKGTAVDCDRPLAVFAPFAAPGDLARVRIESVVKRYAEAEIIEILEPSNLRTAPVCEYFGRCGGCNWQHLRYEEQLRQKSEIVNYVMGRNGLPGDVLRNCHPSNRPLGYRIRADLSFVKTGDGIVGGFLMPRSHDPVDIGHCPLMVPRLSEAMPRIKKAVARWAAEVPTNHLFRVRIVTDPAAENILVSPKLGGALRNIVQGMFVLRGEVLEPARNPLLHYTIQGMRIAFDPDCFTQVNLETNEELVDHAIQCVDPQPSDEILELYGGIGNFTFPLASKAKHVTAVESAKGSARFAKSNAETNKIGNVTHIAADAQGACRRFARSGRRFTKVLVDPPRSGMGEQAVMALCALEPSRIVSVSCHPNTLAKDLKLFRFRGYEIESMEGFDMFGQTFHVETVTVLRKA